MKFCLLLILTLSIITASAQNIIPKKKGSNYIYIDENGRKAFDMKFQDANRFFNDRAAVKKKGKWGFIDHSGNIVVPIRYQKVNSFKSERAIVSNEGNYFLIDKEGKIMSTKDDTLQYVAPEIYAFRQEGLYGFIDNNGKNLSDPIYSFVGKIYNKEVTVKKHDKWITWSTSGENSDNPDLLFIDPEVKPILTKECALNQFPAEQDKCSKAKLLEYIYQNVRYPKEAVQMGIEGMTVIQFIITTEGKVTDARIVRSLAGGLDKEALRVVNNLEDYSNPAYQDGIPVNMLFTLPVRFKL